MKHISGKNFHIMLGDSMIKVETANLSITDNEEVTTTHGVPDGTVDGSVSASGELELKTTYILKIVEAARKAGSFKELEPFDMLFFAKTPDIQFKVEAFGCKIKISSLLDIDTNGGESIKHKLPFKVSSPDFIKINGVPYLASEEIDGLFGG